MDSSAVEAISLSSSDAHHVHGPEDRLQCALWFLDQGLTLVRLRARSKKPHTYRGAWVTASTPERVERWFASDPDVNVGIMCSRKTKIVVVDADRYKGPSGSIDGLDLPPTLTTQGNGTQFVYRTDGRQTISHAPGRKDVQVLGNVHYGACPPSIHPGDPKVGQAPFPYVIAAVHPIADAPEWVYASPSPSAGQERPLEGRQELAGKLRGLEGLRAAQRLLGLVVERKKFGSRHERDFAFAIACISQGVPEADWAEAVRLVPGSKALEGGNKEGDAYLERTWRRALEAPAPVWRTRPSAGSEEARRWRQDALRLRDVDQRHHRVLVALGDIAVKAHQVRVGVANRRLREAAHVQSGAVVAEAIDWGVEHKIIKRIGTPAPGLGQDYKLLPIPDHLLPGPPLGETPPGDHLAPVQDHESGVATRAPSPSTRPTPHGQGGCSVSVPEEDPSQVPAGHPAFHRAALGWSAFLVVNALGDGPLRPADLKPLVPSMVERTLFRALKKLEAHDLVAKQEDERWALLRVDPDLLAEIAAIYGTDKASDSLYQRIGLERDQFADPILCPAPPAASANRYGGPPLTGRDLARVLHWPRNPHTKTSRAKKREAARAERNRSERQRRRLGNGGVRLVNFPTPLDPEWADVLDRPHLYPLAVLPTDAAFVLRHLGHLRGRGAASVDLKVAAKSAPLLLSTLDEIGRHAHDRLTTSSTTASKGRRSPKR